MNTPVGEVSVYIDDEEIDAFIEEVQLDKTCLNLNGRYNIIVKFKPNGEKHTISCCIKDYTPSKEDEIESGENLECMSFYKNGSKLSIGIESDTWYGKNNERLSDYDYDGSYLENGVAFEILPFTKTEKYIFGVAWINDCNEDNHVQTWFGADPNFSKTLK